MKLKVVEKSYTCTLKKPLSDSELDDSSLMKESSDEQFNDEIDEVNVKEEKEIFNIKLPAEIECENEINNCESEYRLNSETDNDEKKRDYEIIWIYPCESGDTKAQWKLRSKGGKHFMFRDNDIGVKVWEMKGFSILSVYGLMPKNSMISLKIKLPILYLMIKYDALILYFEIKFLDSHLFHRRFRFSNFYKDAHIDIFSTKMPLTFFKGWNIVQVDLAKLATSVYRTNFVEVENIEMHANVRIGRIAFLNRMLNNEEIPLQFQSMRLCPVRSNSVIDPNLVSVYSPQSGRVIDYESIYGPKN